MNFSDLRRLYLLLEKEIFVIMSSITPIRDPKEDHLISPENSALILIDYQPLQVNSVRSMDHEELVKNIVNVAKIAKGFGLPIILSTVNVGTGMNKPTISHLQKVLPGIPEIDRTTVNSWEDQEFQDAVKALGKRNLSFVHCGPKCV